jgi:small subunit ribosomal protein S5
MAEEAIKQAANEVAAQNRGQNPNYRGPRPGGQGGRDGGRGPRRDNRGGQPQEEKQFDERVVHIDRVARVVKGGRRFRFRALVVVGDKKGKVGIGIAKGADVTAAVSKATEVAKKQLVKVTLYKGTLPHEARAKVGGANILIMPAAPGTGLIAGGVVRTILEVAGVSNVLSKSLGSSNKANIAYATIEALTSLVPAKNWVTSAKSNDKKEKAAEKSQVKVTEAKTASQVKKAEPAKKPAA